MAAPYKGYKMKKLLAFLSLSMLLTLIGIHRIAYVSSMIYDTEEVDVDIEDTYDMSAFRNATYYRKLNTWLKTYNYISLEEQTILISTFKNANPNVDFMTSSEYTNDVASLDNGEEITLEVNVSETGLYEIGFDFFMPEAYYTIPSVQILINDASQYNEMDDLELEVLWEIVPLEEALRYNRYGNELLPKSESIQSWQKYYADDYNGYSIDNYKFLLNSGNNSITIRALNLPIYIGNLYVKGHESLIDYDTYLSSTNDLPSNTEGEIITIQGESFTTKNDLEIKSSYYKETAMTPYSYKNTVLNQLDGGSMSRGGTLVTYEFDVDKTGYYQIAFKALKNANTGVAAGKNIYIDGEILFSELSALTFDTMKKWTNVTLGGEAEYRFYLTEGHHTISIESTVSQYMEAIDELNTIMDEISSISLLVQTITGGNSDDAIDWDILKYIPTLEADLLSYAEKLESIYETLSLFDEGTTSAAEISTLNVAAKQLRRVAKTPNRIGSKLAEFSEGSGSAYQLIGNAIAALLSQPLNIDAIYIYNDVTLPKPNGSFFSRIWDGIRSFFYSFFDTRYNDAAIEEGTLEVWVGQSSLYLDILQSMIDQDFTTETGIKVKASILSNTSKIVLSNATNDNPDVVLSIDNWNPYAYALRGMLKDLSEYDDFDEVTSNYYANNFTPVIFEEGVYAIPETQSVFLLFYRKDILNYLDLDVPNTWTDVLNMLPILQSHQMNFYHPLGGDAAFKGYGYTSSLIYQFGGEIFTENGISSTLKDPTTVEAIKFMTELFTIYNLPLQVSSFFEHFRSGDMPIGISTIDLYLQLKYAAPELSGQWGVTVVPGRDSNDDGTIERWSTTYGKASILFENSDMMDEGWQLIKWWNSVETQIKFMQNIKTGLGEKFLILSANMNALEASVWDSGIKEQIINQAKWSRIPAVTPGSYIVERELSSIWNKIVIDLMNPSVAINESIPRVTRELNRKFDEFGYATSTNPNGEVYFVPMNSNINHWIKEAYGDDD